MPGDDPQALLREYLALSSAELKRLSEKLDIMERKIENTKRDIYQKIDKVKDDIEGKIDKLRDDQINPFQLETAREISSLKTKAGVWGVLGGAVPVIMFFLYQLIKRAAE